MIPWQEKAKLRFFSFKYSVQGRRTIEGFRPNDAKVVKGRRAQVEKKEGSSILDSCEHLRGVKSTEESSQESQTQASLGLWRGCCSPKGRQDDEWWWETGELRELAPTGENWWEGGGRSRELVLKRISKPSDMYQPVSLLKEETKQLMQVPFDPNSWSLECMRKHVLALRDTKYFRDKAKRKECRWNAGTSGHGGP